MPIQSMSAKIITDVNDAISSELSRILDVQGLDRLHPNLSAGKRIRTQIAVCVAGRRSKKLVKLCTALELLHTSTLIHDDIVDKASQRRNFPTVNSVEGDGVALYLGNLMADRALAIALEVSSQMGSLFLRTSQRVDYGQLSELMDRNNQDRSLDDYYDACRGKTSALLGLAAHIGTAVGGNAYISSVEIVRAIEDLGFAFQIIDDTEDLEKWKSTKEPEIDSKSKQAEYDIELGNYTLPVILSLASAQPDDLESLKTPELVSKWVGSDDRRLDNAIEEARSIAGKHAKDSLELLSSIRRKDPDRIDRVMEWGHRIQAAIASNKGVDQLESPGPLEDRDYV